VYGQMSLWGKFKLMSTLCVSVNENKPDKKFMAMFIGFMDGDGYFDILSKNNITKQVKP